MHGDGPSRPTAATGLASHHPGAFTCAAAHVVIGPARAHARDTAGAVAGGTLREAPHGLLLLGVHYGLDHPGAG